jgi:cell division inhibitor SulA
LLLLVLCQALHVLGRLLGRAGQPVKLLLLLPLLQCAPQLAARLDVCLTGQHKLQLSSLRAIAITIAITSSNLQLISQLVCCCSCCRQLCKAG